MNCRRCAHSNQDLAKRVGCRVRPVLAAPATPETEGYIASTRRFSNPVGHRLPILAYAQVTLENHHPERCANSIN